LTDQENEDNEARRIEAVRVGLRLNRDQTAQVEPTQRAQDCLPWVTAEGISGDLLADYRDIQLQRESTAPARRK
jgi:hypothetical protein